MEKTLYIPTTKDQQARELADLVREFARHNKKLCHIVTVFERDKIANLR